MSSITITAYWDGRRAFEEYGYNRMWASNTYLGTSLSEDWESGYADAMYDYEDKEYTKDE